MGIGHWALGIGKGRGKSLSCGKSFSCGAYISFVFCMSAFSLFSIGHCLERLEEPNLIRTYANRHIEPGAFHFCIVTPPSLAVSDPFTARDGGVTMGTIHIVSKLKCSQPDRRSHLFEKRYNSIAIRDFQINISPLHSRRTGVPPVPRSGQAGRLSYELGNLFFGVPLRNAAAIQTIPSRAASIGIPSI